MTRRGGPPGREASAPPDPRTARTGSGAPGRRGRPGFRSGLKAGRAQPAGGLPGASVSRPRRSRSPSPPRSQARARAHPARAPRGPESTAGAAWRVAPGPPFPVGRAGSGRAPGRGRRGGARWAGLHPRPRERSERGSCASLGPAPWSGGCGGSLVCNAFLAATICCHGRPSESPGKSLHRQVA